MRLKRAEFITGTTQFTDIQHKSNIEITIGNVGMNGI